MQTRLAGKYSKTDVDHLVREAKRLRILSNHLIKIAAEIDLELTLRLIAPEAV